MDNDFENALAWFTSAPSKLNGITDKVTASADWVWEVLQGDFNDNQTTAQIATGTVISMIPFVDQLCDIRDLVANCRNIDKDPADRWHWIGLGLTLLGLFPAVGSLLKGCLKVMFAGIRKFGYTSGIAQHGDKAIDAAVFNLNKFLARPEVIKTLSVLKIDNPLRYLAKNVRALAAKISAPQLIAALDNIKGAADSLLNMVQRWGSTQAALRALAMLQNLAKIKQLADGKMIEAVAPLREFLELLARRLEVEGDMAHRAHLNALNPHAFARQSQAAEIAELTGSLPKWADDTGKLAYKPIDKAPDVPPGWTSTKVCPTRGRHPLDNAHETFNTIRPVTLPPGTKLYRVVDPKSSDNSICWMSEAEFLQLKSKDDWRRKFAVWAHWNSNGEFVSYTVPPGNGLNVWEGITASQRLDGTDFVLEGGARQIVIDPAHLEKSNISKRQLTNWTDPYGDFGKAPSLLGVPTLSNNWFT